MYECMYIVTILKEQQILYIEIHDHDSMSMFHVLIVIMHNGSGKPLFQDMADVYLFFFKHRLVWERILYIQKCLTFK